MNVEDPCLKEHQRMRKKQGNDIIEKLPIQLARSNFCKDNADDSNCTRALAILICVPLRYHSISYDWALT